MKDWRWDHADTCLGACRVRIAAFHAQNRDSTHNQLHSLYGALLRRTNSSPLPRPRTPETTRKISRAMDLTATLTDAESRALSDYNLSIHDAIRYFGQNVAAYNSRNESDFEKSFKLKNTIDVFEMRARAEPSAQALAVLMNCEYLLWQLNKDTPLKQNPFLSHWVEAIQRLDAVGGQRGSNGVAMNGLSADKISAARVLWIKMLLQGEDVKHLLDQTPQKASISLVRESLREPFDLRPYVRMLEDEGIYEKTPEPDTNGHAAPIQQQNGGDTYDHPARMKKNDSVEDLIQQRKADIRRNLELDTDAAIFEITRLPISLSYLDFLTTLLTDHTLESHSIDPAPIITQYIQHALRTIERMGKPPAPSDEGEVLEYGKEAQSRHILLLLLFIKSLIRKGLVEMDTLYYEIAEISVRYVWIKEVRDFRSWAEEGVEGVGT